MVREATPEDARGIAEVQVKAWRVAYSGFLPAQFLDEMSVSMREDSWKSLLAEGGQAALTLVAEDPPGTIAGFCSLALPSRDEDARERTAEVAATYVHPARWGSGLGKSLLRQALERLRDDAWDEATLWIFMRNAQGRAFYARSGFKLDGHKGVHEPTAVPTTRMRVFLTGSSSGPGAQPAVE